MGQKLIITEEDRNSIRQMYNLPNNNDYVFDFVLTENEKYLFIMDQVFVAGGNGNSIGSIWENTHILNEILTESLTKQNILNESNKNDLTNIINNIVWTKNLIKESIKNNTLITEGWLDSIKSGLSSLGKNAVMVGKLLGQGLVSFLRWVRRGLYTGVGIVIDVVVSILAAKTNAIVWIIVSLLDIYEISTNNYDPQDPERRQMPYLLLICDLMGAAFSGGIALMFKKSGQTIAKQGIKKVSPTIVKYLKTLSTKIPVLKNNLKSGANLLAKKMGTKSTGFISTILRMLDNILTKLVGFINKLLSKEGAKATAIGGTVYGTTELVGKGMQNSKIGGKVGEIAKNTDNFFQKNIKSTALTDNEVNDAVRQFQLSVNV